MSLRTAVLRQEDAVWRIVLECKTWNVFVCRIGYESEEY